MLDPVDITLGPAYKRNLNKNMLVIKRYSLYPNFLNMSIRSVLFRVKNLLVIAGCSY